jgi:AraC-like DNA-binding protein
MQQKVPDHTQLESDTSYPLPLRRAISYMAENAAEDITVTDIAAHVFLTPRAIQYIFRRYTDLTPMSYLRDMRLHLAHLDLFTHEPSQLTISALARKWKFMHAGRFSAHYQQVFGCLPTATLRTLSTNSKSRGPDHRGHYQETRDNLAEQMTGQKAELDQDLWPVTTGPEDAEISDLRMQNRILEQESDSLRITSGYLLRLLCQSLSNSPTQADDDGDHCVAV